MNATRGSTVRSSRTSILHKLRGLLRAAPRWTTLTVAVLFTGFYIGLWMSPLGANHSKEVYPDPLPQRGFYLHAIPGSVWLILGALQFFSFIRTKSPQMHRVFGTISLISMLASVAGGMTIVYSGKTLGGKSLSYFGTLFFAWWTLCCSLGWYNMRYLRNIPNHRAWMLRAYMVSYAIILMRPATVLLCVLDSTKSVGQSLAITAPLLWFMSVITSEVYLNRSGSNHGGVFQSLTWMYQLLSGTMI